jgi:hypothetical protein
LNKLGGVHIVAVVGPFHTGKSFLLNQLMGMKDGNGFSIGPTTKPSTKGAWVWGIPGGAAGLKRPILLLDTEGFSAPENKADYDAKIFAVATLLSSHLLYNSVRMIDQRDIEHLELMARRTQMFEVKATLEKRAGSDQLSGGKFPGFTWVVEDFVQEMEKGETPKQWLDRLLDAQSLGDDAKRGLRSMFTSTDCKTMSIPTFQGQKLLAHLDSKSVVLATEYESDIDALRRSIVESLKQRERDDSQVRSGASIVNFLNILVKAANGGAMSKVPSMWASFLKHQIDEAKSTAQEVHEANLAPSLARTPPLPHDEFDKSVAAAMKEATAVYHKLLVGVDSAHSQAGAKTLDAALKRASANLVSQNDQRVKDYIETHTQKAMDDFKAGVHAVKIPQASKDLGVLLAPMAKTAKAGVYEVTKAYSKLGAGMQRRREDELKFVTTEYTNKNGRLLRQLLTQASQTGEQTYTTEMQKVLDQGAERCVTDAVLDQEHKVATKRAIDAFQAACGVARNEPEQVKELAFTEKKISSVRGRVDATNNACVVKLVTKHRKALADAVYGAYSRLNLPFGPEALQVRVTQEESKCLAEYDAKLAPFRHTDAVQAQRKTLQAELAKEVVALKKNNARAIKNLVERPLRRAKEDLEHEAGAYYIPWSFTSRARSVALERIKKTGSLPEQFLPYLDDAVEAWIQEEMKSVVGSVSSRLWFAVAGVVTVVLGFGALLYMNAKKSQELAKERRKHQPA